jgi:hypothetical protein
MKIRFAMLAALASVLAVAASTATAAAPEKTALSVAITPAQSGGVLNGVFEVTSFGVNSARQLVAKGTFTGSAVIGGVTQTITTRATSVVTNRAAQAARAGAQVGSCRILMLRLGPLHLDLLGLVVDLSQVNLDITAQPGPGNLLGNLLCAITHLLDSGIPTPAIRQILIVVNWLLS